MAVLKKIETRDSNFHLRTMANLLKWRRELGYSDRSAVVTDAVKHLFREVFGEELLDKVLSGEIKVIKDDIEQYEKHRHLIQTTEAIS